MEFDRFKVLARTVAEPHDAARCTACLDQLDAYVEAQLVGQPYATWFPDVAEHLDRCVACAESYVRLYDARSTTASAVVPPTKRVPDVRFLLPADAPQPTSRLTPTQLRGRLRTDRLRTAVQERVQQSVGRVRLLIDQTLLDLMPPRQGGLAFRDTSEPQPLMDLTVPSPTDQITHLELRAYQQDAALRTVRCTVALSDREWPDLGDITVRLLWDTQQREMVTDAWGEVVFTDIPDRAMAQMTLEVDVPVS